MLILLLMCGCTAQKQVSPVIDNISFTADITYVEQNYVCDATILDSTLNLCVIEPENIKGLSLKIDKNGVTAEFKGIEHAMDVNSLPQNAVIQILFKILNDITDKTIDVSRENCEITGNIDGNKYLFVFSPSGLPISLKIDNLDIEIKFNNVTLK